MYNKKINLGLVLVLLFGMSSLGLSSGGKSKKELSAELDQVKEENAALKKQVEELNTKLELLLARIDQLEKMVEVLKAGNAGQLSAGGERIEEEEVVIEAHGGQVDRKGATPNLPVVKISPENKPPQNQTPTKKVIVFTDDKNNPNNPKIKIEKAPAGKSAPGRKPEAPADSGTKPVSEKKAELKTNPPETKPAEAKAASLDDIKKMIEQKQYAQAEKEAKARLLQKPGEKEACPLYFYLGEARSGAGKGGEAAAAFLKLADLYPACELAPEAMFKAGELYEKTDKARSRKIYEDIVSLYPYSNYANLAEEKLKK
jgi:TolA-binding protein